jgi:hypothetical protein
VLNEVECTLNGNNFAEINLLVNIVFMLYFEIEAIDVINLKKALCVVTDSKEYGLGRE